MATGVPAVDLVVGMASHAFLDELVDEPVINWTDPHELRRNGLWIAWQIVGALAVMYFSRSWWGMLGGVLPDLIDGARSLVNRSAWMKGQHLFWFHRYTPDKAWRRFWPTWAVVVTEIAMVALVALGRVR